MKCNQEGKKKKEQDKQLQQYISESPLVKAINQQAQIDQRLQRTFKKKDTVVCQACNIF